jgi:hypothetical protein
MNNALAENVDKFANGQAFSFCVEDRPGLEARYKKACPALQPFDLRLAGLASIYKDKYGNLTLCWIEDHPEAGDMFEYFGKDKEPFLPLTDAELAQWRKLRKALPFKYREVEITRQEAFRLRMISSFADDEFDQEIEPLLQRLKFWACETSRPRMLP